VAIRFPGGLFVYVIYRSEIHVKLNFCINVLFCVLGIRSGNIGDEASFLYYVFESSLVFRITGFATTFNSNKKEEFLKVLC
jgi:hypothetical protein